MPERRSIHIGLNHLNEREYPGYTPLRGCVNDANAMADIARREGIRDVVVLLEEQAQATAVREALGAAARQLHSGDLLIVTFAGHGNQVEDSNGDEEEGSDETWCLFDREMLDDELYGMWATFEPGVRIFVLSDSCHSGTVVSITDDQRATCGEAVRALPPEVAKMAYERNRELYAALQAQYPDGRRVEIRASVLLLAACQDDELTSDGPQYGAFTAAVLKVWDEGRFDGDYRRLRERVESVLDHGLRSQQPKLTRAGAEDPTFEESRPFAA